jgi:hypothetical protein
MTYSARRRRSTKGRRLRLTNLRIHALLVVGVPICVAAGWFEWTRALGGREIAWIYAFEWPIFGVYGVYIWWRLYREKRSATSTATIPHANADVAPSTAADSNEAEARPSDSDAQLVAWQRYLSALQAVDPPGQPPGRSS